MPRVKECRKEFGFGGEKDIPDFFLIKLPPTPAYMNNDSDILSVIHQDDHNTDYQVPSNHSDLENLSLTELMTEHYHTEDNMGDRTGNTARMDDNHRASGYDSSFTRKPRETAPIVLTSGPLPAKLKWFNEEKGFGFVTVTMGGVEEDLFIHISAFIRAGIQSAPPLGTALTVWKGAGKGGKEAALQVEVPTKAA